MSDTPNVRWNGVAYVRRNEERGKWETLYVVTYAMVRSPVWALDPDDAWQTWVDEQNHGTQRVKYVPPYRYEVIIRPVRQNEHDVLAVVLKRGRKRGAPPQAESMFDRDAYRKGSADASGDVTMRTD